MDYRVWIICLFIFVATICLLAVSGLMSRPRNIVLCTTLTVLTLGLRMWCLPHITLDYTNFLSTWIQFFRDNGGVFALKYSVGNYNVPYLYFLSLFSYSDLYGLYQIKLLSIFFDIILAWAGHEAGRCIHPGHGQADAGFLRHFVFAYSPAQRRLLGPVRQSFMPPSPSLL